MPEWTLSSGHAHPDANSFIIWAHGRYLTGDTGYSGLVSARQHNTITVGGLGQGVETDHDVWRGIPYATLDRTRIVSADLSASTVRIVGDATSSYPGTAALTRFTRTFTFQAPDRFIIEDVVDTASSKSIEYYLHADQAVRGGQWTYQVGPPDVWLETTIAREGRNRAAWVRAEGLNTRGDVDPNQHRNDRQTTGLTLPAVFGLAQVISESPSRIARASLR